MKEVQIEGGLYLHIGCHRTGTSSFQNFLGLNRERMEALGVRLMYPNRDGAEGGRLRLKLPRPRDQRSKGLSSFEISLQRQFRKHGIKQGMPILLSEENILGTIGIASRGQMYAGSTIGLKFLVQNSGMPVRRIYLTIRNYEDFFVSCYRKRAEWKLLEPFAVYGSKVSGLNKTWVNLIEEIKMFSGCEIVVRAFENHLSEAGQLNLLFPQIDTDEFEGNLGRSNESKSALEIGDIQKEFWERQHSEAFEGIGELTFSDEQTKTFQARYEADLKEISKMDGVTLVR